MNISTQTHDSHTPGPWRAEGASVYSVAHERDYSTNPQDAPYIWRVCDAVRGKSDEEIRGNFALIAAAPELLDALRSLAQAVYDNRQWLSGPAYQRVVAWADAAMTVIAKAEGAEGDTHGR